MVFGTLLHVGCHNSPPPTQDLVPRSKHEKARDTKNGDDFTLPRCLLLRVMCTLHLEELHGLVASLALRRVKNTDWTLRVRKIRTQLDLAQVNSLLWLLETLFQLGHVGHIMHHSQAIWKLEAERERSSSLKNMKRTNEPGSQLAFDPKTVSAPKW